MKRSVSTPDWFPRSRGASAVKGKVLLVEEDRNDLDYYAGILRAQGYEVVVCACPREGLSFLERDAFECVVVTQASPAFEGQCVLERAVDIDRHMPVLVLTRCPNMACYLNAMQLGAVDYMEKPVPPEKLVWAIETHLRRRSSTA